MPNTFTPGPWFEYGGSIYGHGDTPGDTYIAEMAYGEGMNETSKEQALINARLIAAAPELLEALIGVHSFEFPTTRPDSLCWCPPKWHDYPAGQQPPHSAQCQEAKDAIAKAIGAQA